MSVPQSRNQLLPASFQMGKKKIIKFPFPPSAVLLSSGLTFVRRPGVNTALLKSCVQNTQVGLRPASPRSKSKTNTRCPAASHAEPSAPGAQPRPWENRRSALRATEKPRETDRGPRLPKKVLPKKVFRFFVFNSASTGLGLGVDPGGPETRADGPVLVRSIVGKPGAVPAPPPLP